MKCLRSKKRLNGADYTTDTRCLRLNPKRRIRIPEVPVGPALPHPVAYSLQSPGTALILRVVLDGLGIVPCRMILVAEVPVRTALPRPVPHLLCNRHALIVVFDGLGLVRQQIIRSAESEIDPRSPVRH
jgi:hypothetical protein